MKGIFYVFLLGYGLTPHSLDSDEKQTRFYHILNELFKFAYGKRSAMGDEYDSQTEKNQDIEGVRKRISNEFMMPKKFPWKLNIPVGIDI